MRSISSTMNVTIMSRTIFRTSGACSSPPNSGTAWGINGGGGGGLGSVGRQVADDQDNTRSGGAIGPHAHGNAPRHVVDDLDAEGSGQQNP